MSSRRQGYSDSSYKDQARRVTNGDAERNTYRVALGFTIFIMAVLTVLNFCSALGVVDLRLTSTSIHSSNDIQTDKYRPGLCPCDVEMARAVQRIIHLEAQVEALRSKTANTVEKMEALNLEVSNIYVKENKTAARVSTLIEQNKESSVKFARINTSVEVLNLEVSDIHAKGNETAAKVSTLIEQMDALSLELSDVQVQANETAAQVSILTKQNEEASVTFAKINASLDALSIELSDVQVQANETAAQVSILTKQNEVARMIFAKINASLDVLSTELSDVQVQANETTAQVSILTKQMNSIVQRTSILESRRTGTSGSNSHFRPCKELSAVALLILIARFYW